MNKNNEVFERMLRDNIIEAIVNLMSYAEQEENNENGGFFDITDIIEEIYNTWEVSDYKRDSMGWPTYLQFSEEYDPENINLTQIVIDEIKKMINIGMLESGDSDDFFGNAANVKISQSYMKNTTSDFNLEESKLPRASDEVQKKLKAEILELMTMFDFADAVYSNAVVSIIAGRYGKNHVKKFSNSVTKAIHELVDDGTLVFMPGPTARSPLIKFSPEYLERETKDFNLDESLRAVIRKIISENVLSLSNTRNAAE